MSQVLLLTSILCRTVLDEIEVSSARCCLTVPIVLSLESLGPIKTDGLASARFFAQLRLYRYYLDNAKDVHLLFVKLNLPTCAKCTEIDEC